VHVSIVEKKFILKQGHIFALGTPENGKNNICHRPTCMGEDRGWLGGLISPCKVES
jgi:ABC-type lipopolysaccharide export system ATPase subunit